MSIRARIIACWAVTVLLCSFQAVFANWFQIHVPGVQTYVPLANPVFVFLLFRWAIPCASRGLRNKALLAMIIFLLLPEVYMCLPGSAWILKASIYVLGWISFLAFFGALIWSDILQFRRQEAVA